MAVSDPAGPKRFDHAQFRERLEAVTQERRALEGSYVDVDAQAGELHRRWRDGELPPPEAVQEFAKLAKVLLNYIEVERAQVGALFELLLDAYASLVEAYED